MNYYQLLNLDRSATPAEIKQRYRLLVRTHHPDVRHRRLESLRGGEFKQVEKQFVLIVEAYRTLVDPDLRRQYDIRLQQESGLSSSAQPAPGSRGTGSGERRHPSASGVRKASPGRFPPGRVPVRHTRQSAGSWRQVLQLFLWIGTLLVLPAAAALLVGAIPGSAQPGLQVSLFVGAVEAVLAGILLRTGHFVAAAQPLIPRGSRWDSRNKVFLGLCGLAAAQFWAALAIFYWLRRRDDPAMAPLAPLFTAAAAVALSTLFLAGRDLPWALLFNGSVIFPIMVGTWALAGGVGELTHG